MKITFIYLPRPYLKQPDSQSPLGILYLKSMIDNHGYFGVTCDVKNYSSYTNEEAINDLSESDIYGITVTSLELPLANEFSKLIKQKYPNSKIILGGAGIDSSLAFIDYVNYDYVNSCFIGEAENGIFDVINDYRYHEKLQLYYKGSPFRELDFMPFPDRKCLGDNQGGNIFAFDKKYKGNQSTVILTSRGCPFKCVHGDTLVNTINGKIKIKDLVGKQDVKVLTRDLNTKEVLFSEATNICKTDENKKLVRVMFDDDSYIDCTPDHKFMAFTNGNQFVTTEEKEVNAIDLKEGQSVRAIHYEKSGKNYIAISWRRRKRKKLHRMAMESILSRKLNNTEHVHHIDGDTKNNLPDNLVLTNKNEHVSKFHPEVSERMKGKNNPVYFLSKEELTKRGKSNKGKKRSLKSRLNYRNNKMGEKNPNYTNGERVGQKTRIKELQDTNHKVKSVKYIDGLHDTYCMTVKGFDWFYANDVLVHNCAFCSSPKYENVKSVRFRSPKNVYEEIKQVKEELNIHQFRFSDDMFTARPFKQFKELCDYLKDLNIVFRVSCRVKPFTNEIAKILLDSGCKEVSFGIESFDNHVLKVLNKKTTAEDNFKAIEIAKDAGLTVRALMMIRTPGQRKETVDININYIEKSNFNICTCSSFVPLPGSDLWDHPDKYDIEILTKNLTTYNFFFYGKDGENELHDIIKLKDRSLKEFNEETLRFKEFMKSTNRLNMG